MAEFTMSEESNNISALRDTLYAQQNLLQKLYNELDAEREASASAADEALSVILRLQGEKAAVKMEAEHYKRLSESKICHAEESLAIIEDIIHHKEMEIAALDHQVQSYRYKLLSMGCNDLEKTPSKNIEDLDGETDFNGLGRINSVPVSFKYSCIQEMSDSDKKIDNSCIKNSYWDQIKKLDERVKEITGDKYVNSGGGARSTSSVSSETTVGNENEQSYEKKTANLLQNVDNSCSLSVVHDVFEVPQADGNLSSCKDFADKPCDSNDDSGLLEKVLKSNLCENKKIGDFANIECHLAFVQPGTSMSGSEQSQQRLNLNQVNGTSEIVEVGRISECSNREEELRLLNEIKESVDLLHDEIMSLKVKKLSKRDDEPSLCALSEAMLYFWL